MVDSIQGGGAGAGAVLDDLKTDNPKQSPDLVRQDQDQTDHQGGRMSRSGDANRSALESYGVNNGAELAWTSKVGAWVHQRATYLVIGRHLTKEENRALAYSHFAADAPQFQGPDSNHRHAMRRENQTIAEARQDANKFVREQFSKAWNAKTRHEALTEFGIALHALQDSTSPAHAGFQEWSDHPDPLEWPAHLVQEFINPGEGSELFRATQQAWDWFNAGVLPTGNLFIFGCDGCTA